MSDVRLGLLMQRWPSRERPFGPYTPFVQHLTTLAKSEQVSVCAFDPDDVNLPAQAVLAHRWQGPEEGWLAEETPLPDVLWNRYFKRDERALIQGLQRTGVPMINEGALDKWDAYRRLAKDPEARNCLPETRLLIEARTAMEMLDRFPVVFLKPVRGSVGRGIIRCRRADADLLVLQYVSSETDGLREVYANERQLDRWITDRGRQGRYIVQQGLPLHVFHCRPADVRVLVQKDGEGRWGVTGMGCRVAGDGRFTANLHTGGRGVPVELLAEAIHPYSPDRRRALPAELEHLALHMARLVEEGSRCAMGELGLDFGVDAAGQIWYIEQNAQPGRAIFEHLGRRDLSDLAHLRPVQYARFLATTKSARAARALST